MEQDGTERVDRTTHDRPTLCAGRPSYQRCQACERRMILEDDEVKFRMGQRSYDE
jgi:hypothetical protein